MPDVPIELMQRIWANLYYNEAEAGDTFQWTLNEVVDWLAKHGAGPPPTRWTVSFKSTRSHANS